MTFYLEKCDPLPLEGGNLIEMSTISEMHNRFMCDNHFRSSGVRTTGNGVGPIQHTLVRDMPKIHDVIWNALSQLAIIIIPCN